jgi:hypothetical protein
MFFMYFFLEPYILNGKDRTPPCPVRVCGIGVAEKWIVDSIIDHRILENQSTLSKGSSDPITVLVLVIYTHQRICNIGFSGLIFLFSLLLGLVLTC